MGRDHLRGDRLRNPPVAPQLTLGRLRVLAGTVGLAPGVWAHLPPEEEEKNLIEFLGALIPALEAKGMTLEEHFALVEAAQGHGLPGVVPIGQRRGGLR